MNPKCKRTGHAGGIGSVDFSPGGKWVVSGSADGLVKIWNTATGAEVGPFCECVVGGAVIWEFHEPLTQLLCRKRSDTGVRFSLSLSLSRGRFARCEGTFAK